MACHCGGIFRGQEITVFTMVLPSAFLQSMAAFTAQDIGAGTCDRAKKGLHYMLLAGIGVGICLAALCEFGGGSLVRAFANDTDTIFYAAQYLKGFALDPLVGCVVLTMIGYLTAAVIPLFVMIQGLIGAFLVRVPVVLLLSGWQDITFYLVKGGHLTYKGT